MPPKEKTALLVGEGLVQNLQLISALHELQLEVQPVADPENVNALSCFDLTTSIIIFEDFVGPLFDSLRRSKIKMFGVPMIIGALNSETGERRLFESPHSSPLYCQYLRNCKIAVTGMRSREQLHEIRRYILYMGGTFLEKEAPFTHLVADKVRGVKYRDAVALGKPILKPEWVTYLWSQRDQGVDLTSKLEDFKVKAFHKCNIAFEGFEDLEKNGMLKLVEPNGGSVVEPDSPEATHIVRANVEAQSTTTAMCPPSLCTPPRRTDQLENDIDLTSPKKRPRFELYVINDLDERIADVARKKECQPEKAKVMKVEWFWSSIQIEACAAESEYMFFETIKPLDEFGNASLGTFANSFTSPLLVPLSDTDGGTPNSNTGTPQSLGRRKRKCREMLSPFVLAAANEKPRFITDIPEDVEAADLGGKSLDQTPQEMSDAVFATLLKDVTEVLNKADYNSMSHRQIEFKHLLETERNYVGILMSIIKHFKEPCENEQQPGGRILDPVEVRTIFGTILPIYALHRQLLRDLAALYNNWDEENLIGKVYCDRAKGFQKAYEPFVNFFETTKAEIARCETEKPRFLAFIRIAQGRAECGKQSLADWMIRPIQRLPSTVLILTNLKKHTSESNLDYSWICQGLESMNAVNKGINEEKRVTESRIVMFDLYNEIEGFPSYLISAQRQLTAKIDCLALNNLFGQKYDPITVLVFNDHIQLAKRRNNAAMGSRTLGGTNASVANLRSPSLSRKSIMPGGAASHQSNQSGKYKYKFLEKIELEDVKRVVEISDVAGAAFSLIVRGRQDVRERILAFNALEDSFKKWTKESVVTLIAKQIANYLQRIDHGCLMATADSSQLHLHDSVTVLEKASKFASKTRNKVTRALSLSRTPNRLKRTVSHMMSPFSSARRTRQPDQDSLSEDSTCSTSTTPLRPNFSTASLWGWGTKRGTGESTPKSRPTLSEKCESSNSIFEPIQES